MPPVQKRKYPLPFSEGDVIVPRGHGLRNTEWYLRGILLLDSRKEWTLWNTRPEDWLDGGVVIESDLETFRLATKKERREILFVMAGKPFAAPPPPTILGLPARRYWWRRYREVIRPAVEAEQAAWDKELKRKSRKFKDGEVIVLRHPSSPGEAVAWYNRGVLLVGPTGSETIWNVCPAGWIDGTAVVPFMRDYRRATPAERWEILSGMVGKEFMAQPDKTQMERNNLEYWKPKIEMVLKPMIDRVDDKLWKEEQRQTLSDPGLCPARGGLAFQRLKEEK